MPYLHKAGSFSNNPTIHNTNSNMRDYGIPRTGLWRHDYTSAILGSGNVLANSYLPIPLLQFKRTFGGTDDVPPTPTAGNNFQTPDVFNGSRIENFQATVNIKNDNSSGFDGYLTIYEAAYSFWDAYLHNAIYSTQCPVTFDSTGVAPDTRGQVTLKTPSATLISTNLNKSLKFLQHYIKPIGKIYVPERAANPAGVQINLKGIPEKVKRANSGMAYYLFIHNDTTDNHANPVACFADVEVKFDEIPSENRLPYLT